MLLSTANHPSIFTLTHSLARSSVAPFIDSLPQLRTSLRSFAASPVKSYGVNARSISSRETLLQKKTLDYSGEAARFVVAECGSAAWSDGEPSGRISEVRSCGMRLCRMERRRTERANKLKCISHMYYNTSQSPRTPRHDINVTK